MESVYRYRLIHFTDFFIICLSTEQIRYLITKKSMIRQGTCSSYCYETDWYSENLSLFLNHKLIFLTMFEVRLPVRWNLAVVLSLLAREVRKYCCKSSLPQLVLKRGTESYLLTAQLLLSRRNVWSLKFLMRFCRQAPNFPLKAVHHYVRSSLKVVVLSSFDLMYLPCTYYIPRI